MKHVMVFAAFAWCAGLLAGPPHAMAQPDPKVQISVKYVQPRNPKLNPVRQRLMDRRVLEEMAEFLSPLRLKRNLTLSTDQCDQVNAFYQSGAQKLQMCYELVEETRNALVPFVEGRYTLPNGEVLKPTIQGVTRGEAIVGSFLGTMFHEMGHAVFDLQDIPVLGKEEDGADQLAAFLLVQFGPDVARTAIKGLAADWDFSAQRLDWNVRNGKRQHPYYDVHSLHAQRMYMTLCIGYGALPAVFQDLVDQGLLPRARAANCPNEYKQVAHAFGKTLLPDIDREQMEIVRKKKWLRTDDLN